MDPMGMYFTNFIVIWSNLSDKISKTRIYGKWSFNLIFWVHTRFCVAHDFPKVHFDSFCKIPSHESSFLH